MAIHRRARQSSKVRVSVAWRSLAWSRCCAGATATCGFCRTHDGSSAFDVQPPGDHSHLALVCEMLGWGTMRPFVALAIVALAAPAYAGSHQTGGGGGRLSQVSAGVRGAVASTPASGGSAIGDLSTQDNY